MNKNILKALLLGATLTAFGSAMDVDNGPRSSSFGIIADYLGQKGPLTMELRDGISAELVGADRVDSVTATLENRGTLQVRGDDKSAIGDTKILSGYTFPPVCPWNILAATCIRKLHENTGERVRAADWACGKGSFTFQAIAAGANIKGLDIYEPAAKEAIEYIWGNKDILGKKVNVKENFTVSSGSVITPPDKFKDRKNQVSVAFNLIHQLKPAEVEKLFQNIWENLEPGGVVFICSDTPHGYPKGDQTYAKNVREGKKYPGYGLVNQTTILIPGASPNSLQVKSQNARSFKNISKKDDQQIQMGCSTVGSTPPNNFRGATDKQDILMRDPKDERLYPFIDPDGFMRDILASQTGLYIARNTYVPMNTFEYSTLKRVVEEAGFAVINAWYTNKDTNIMSPCYNSPMDYKIVMAISKPL